MSTLSTRWMLLVGIVCAQTLPLYSATDVVLAEGGKANFPIVVSDKASDATRASATELAEMLKRITGATFDVLPKKDPEGIVVGTVAEFPQLATAPFDTKSSMHREDYLLRTSPHLMALIGASDYGVSDAVWDFLRRLGYRQYFPGKDWEIVPHLPTLKVNMDSFESPDYIVRTIFPGYGVWPDEKTDVTDWRERNRMSQGAFNLETGHSYAGIINEFKAQFDADPSLRSIINGKPTSKLNVGNPKTRDLAVQAKIDAVDKALKAGKTVDSVSMEPSDGGGWGTSPEELAIGSPSDRAVFLANEVAQKLGERFGDIYVGMYAYNEHSPAPTHVRVDPRVIVSFATSFLKGDKTLEQNMTEWKNAGVKQFGIREYYSVYVWDREEPGEARGSRLDYLARTIPDFYKQGARFMMAEAGDNWGECGLGYYMASLLLWDSKQTLTPDEVIQEFVQNCFPEAKTPMTKFYTDIIVSRKERSLPVNPDLLGRMFRLLAEARKDTHDPAATTRLDDLVLYTQHLVNYQHLGDSVGKEKQTAYENFFKFAWRMRKTHMITSYCIWRADQGRKAADLTVPPEADWKIPEGKNPWKPKDPFTPAEIDTMVADGIKNNPVLDVTPVAFSHNLVPATGIPSLAGKDDSKEVASNFRGTISIYTQIEDPSVPLTFTAIPGMIYHNLGEARFGLFPNAETSEMTGDSQDDAAKSALPLFASPISSAAIPPDDKPHEIKLTATHPGIYIMQMTDRTAGTQIAWPKNRKFTMEYSLSMAKVHSFSHTKLVFYVPKGTKTIGAFAAGNGKIVGPDGTMRFKLGGKPGYINVPVANGDDGQCWTFDVDLGSLRLLTVPPFMAPSVAQLLLPAEVVEADSH